MTTQPASEIKEDSSPSPTDLDDGEENSKKRPNPSGEDETEKLAARREANRVHALKSRQRSKALLQELQRTVELLNGEKSEMERENAVLRAQVEVLQQQNLALTQSQRMLLVRAGGQHFAHGSAMAGPTAASFVGPAAALGQALGCFGFPGFAPAATPISLPGALQHALAPMSGLLQQQQQNLQQQQQATLDASAFVGQTPASAAQSALAQATLNLQAAAQQLAASAPSATQAPSAAPAAVTAQQSQAASNASGAQQCSSEVAVAQTAASGLPQPNSTPQQLHQPAQTPQSVAETSGGTSGVVSTATTAANNGPAGGPYSI
ncbi:hypothetical protein ACA910_010503 [Epithemia clementina (nom. ined.)]